MGEIGGDTWGVDDIVESQLIDEWGGLEEEGQWLRQSALAIILSCWGLSEVQYTCPIPPEAPATTTDSSAMCSPISSLATQK